MNALPRLSPTVTRQARRRLDWLDQCHHHACARTSRLAIAASRPRGYATATAQTTRFRGSDVPVTYSSSATSASTSTSPSPSHETAPFRFDTGMALFAKRLPRPFPPPFLSPPSGSFSDPLSTHDQSRDRRENVNGTLIKGCTNGDDAAYASERFICANDGVGAWATRPRGHAGLWSRLIQHFWATEVEEDAARHAALGDNFQPDLLAYLQHAYQHTMDVTAEPDWQGTTTASAAQLHFRRNGDARVPVVYVTSLGDSQVMVIRPRDRKLLYKTTEQWHWFDCPRQLGTNSPDTPVQNAVSHAVDVQPGDVVIAMTDGVIDNLWDHEIVETVVAAIERWERGAGGKVMLTPGSSGDRTWGRSGGMRFAAIELMEAARKIAADPFAESPFMERAIEEGLPMVGGKPDDISVVAALCLENK